MGEGAAWSVLESAPCFPRWWASSPCPGLRAPPLWCRGATSAVSLESVAASRAVPPGRPLPGSAAVGGRGRQSALCSLAGSRGPLGHSCRPRAAFPPCHWV